VLKRRIPRHPFALPSAEVEYPACRVAASSGTITKHGRARVSPHFRRLTLLVQPSGDAALLVPFGVRPAAATRELEDGVRSALQRLPKGNTPKPSNVEPTEPASPPTPKAPKAERSPAAVAIPAVDATPGSRPRPPIPPRQ
jgi:hypothetical protein